MAELPFELHAGDRSLLIVDGDEPFRRQLGRAMERRGFSVVLAGSVAEARCLISRSPPAYAVVGLRLDDGNGLDLVTLLAERRPDARVVVLTGYASIAAAVAAIKRGARDFLAKPADIDAIVHALLDGDAAPPLPENPMSADRVRWEHIQRVHALFGYNVSETARRLNMHRRTLQRILAKRCPK